MYYVMPYVASYQVTVERKNNKTLKITPQAYHLIKKLHLTEYSATCKILTSIIVDIFVLLL
jgi:hypothetical protein